MIQTLKNILIIVLAIIVIAFFWNFHKARRIQTSQVQNNTTPIVNNTIVEGNKDDLVSFSIVPGVSVHGILSYRGTLKGGYFFEGNVLVKILDADKKIVKQSNAIAKTDWMTAGPVDFEGNIDFTGLSSGAGYFEIQNDNPSGLPENDKSILIPIIIQ